MSETLQDGPAAGGGPGSAGGFAEASQSPAGLSEQDVMDVLGHVFDPELQMNIVELGLVYGVQVEGEGRVKVRMTLTSPGCPYGPQLMAEVKAMLMMLRGVKAVEVELAWEPPWGPEKMSEAARLELGFDV